jgi:Xaa-Pro aminopeptidase
VSELGQSDARFLEAQPDDLGAVRLKRLARIRASMQNAGVDACLLSLGADLPWCSGYEAMPLERPTVLVLPVDEQATLVVPALEAPRVATDERLFSLRTWSEAEDPNSIVAGLLGKRRSLAISDRAHAALLLALQQHLPNASWQKASLITGSLRAVKDPAELAALAAAGRAADAVSTALLAGEIRLIGRTEAEVAQEITDRLIAEGHDKVTFAIVGSGPNAASPHHHPGNRVIAKSETVVCDFGGTFHLGGDIGYCSDTTRTVVTGTPPHEVAIAYDALEKAQARAVATVAPGIACEDIDRAGRDIIASAGFGANFTHRIGHGIGVEEHEDPYIIGGNADLLVPGNVFSVEPGIYVQGHFGARIEDIVAVSEKGVVSLNCVDRALHVVEA